MAVDPAAQAVLDMLMQPGVPALNELPVPAAREAYAGLAALAGEPAPVARTKDTTADGVPVRLYWPEGDGPHPVLIWIHGGGWVVGSAAVSDATARDLCRRAGCLVVNVDYRLAPEHPFPAALEDVTTVAKWVSAEIGPSAVMPAGSRSVGTRPVAPSAPCSPMSCRGRSLCRSWCIRPPT